MTDEQPQVQEEAQVETEQVFKQHDSDDAYTALAERVPQNHPGVRRIEAVVDFEPISHSHPHQYGKAEQQRFGLNCQEKMVLEAEMNAGLVRGFKGERRNQDIRNSE